MLAVMLAPEANLTFSVNVADSQATLEPQLQMQLQQILEQQSPLHVLYQNLHLPQQLGNL